VGHIYKKKGQLVEDTCYASCSVEVGRYKKIISRKKTGIHEKKPGKGACLEGRCDRENCRGPNQGQWEKGGQWNSEKEIDVEQHLLSCEPEEVGEKWGEKRPGKLKKKRCSESFGPLLKNGEFMRIQKKSAGVSSSGQG